MEPRSRRQERLCHTLLEFVLGGWHDSGIVLTPSCRRQHMATTYTSKIDVKCWKEHTCVGCGGSFAYLFERKIKGTGSTAAAATAAARTAAEKAVKSQVDQHPCPTCGLFQPDMIGAQRAARHWYVFWAASALVGLQLLLLAFGALTAVDVAWSISIGLLALTAVNYVIAAKNPNRDPENNRAVALEKVNSKTLHLGQPGSGSAPDQQWLQPVWSVGQWIAIGALVFASLLAAFGEQARFVHGWPVSDAFHPGVVGPGDSAWLWLPTKISSVKSNWYGAPVVMARPADKPDAAPWNIPATAKQDNWGDHLSVKSSETDSSSTLWVRIKVPEKGQAQAGQTLHLDISMPYSYPKMQGAGVFNVESGVANHSTDVVLSEAGAGQLYNNIWWIGIGVGISLFLLGTYYLARCANNDCKLAIPTKVSTVE